MDVANCGPLGLDLDGTIDQCPKFFSVLSHVWPNKVYIITFRSDKEAAIEYANKFNIRFDELHLAKYDYSKADLIKSLGIGAYFDDMDEFITYIPESDVAVFKVRNGGNYADGKWIYSNRTGTKIGS